jgi:hypothetical protein
MKDLPVEQVIDDIVDEIESHLDDDKLHESSFHVFLLDLITKVMNVVELLQKDQSGQIKKQIVIKVGEKIVEHHFPKHVTYYKENVGIIVEVVIQSFYMLKQSKTIHDMSKCCFPCLFTKK